MAWGSISQAHLEAVRVEAIFPTAGRSGIQLQIFGADSGLKITGAKVELDMRGPGVSETVPFKETQPGIYRVDRGFEAGNYRFRVIDKTFDYETLERVVEAALPRPSGQDAQIWLWPATPIRKPQPPTSNPLVLTLILLPVGLLILGGLVLILVSRRTRSPGVDSAEGV